MIRPGSVKICSLREVEHAQFVLDAGTDLFGLIFVPGVRRQVTVERAHEIVCAVRARGESAPLAVGVFVDAAAEEINATVRDVGLDLIQLHGVEPSEMIAQLDAPVIKVFRPKPGTDVGEVSQEIEQYLRAEVPPVAFLLDGYDTGRHGGSGTRTDWRLAAELAADFPIVLAGGLTPENVGEAVESVAPLAVDVGSGVETDGVKDSAKVSAFVAAAIECFARLSASA